MQTPGIAWVFGQRPTIGEWDWGGAWGQNVLSARRGGTRPQNSRLFNARSSTPTPVFPSSRDETQTMVGAKLGPKLRPPQTLYLLGKGKLRPWSKLLGRENSDHGLSFGCFWGALNWWTCQRFETWPLPRPPPLLPIETSHVCVCVCVCVCLQLLPQRPSPTWTPTLATLLGGKPF